MKILEFQASVDSPEKALIDASGSLLVEAELPRFNSSAMIQLPIGEVRLTFLPKLLGEEETFPPNVLAASKCVKVIKNPIAEDGYYSAVLYFLTKEGGGPRRFVKQMWEHRSADRQLLSILSKPAPVHAPYCGCAPIKDF